MATKENDVDFEPNNIQKSSNWASKLNSTKEFVWNSSKSEFIGRTWSSWAKIGLFYVVFYACLAAFFAIMLMGFFSTLDEKAPTQQKMYSLIKANPGMGFRPMPNIETTLIKFKQGNRLDYIKNVDSINKYLDEYYQQAGPNVVNCTGIKREDLKEGQVCKAGESMFHQNCSRSNDYGYDEGQPCVLLKINKVYAWEPEQFDDAAYADENNQYAKDALKKLGNQTNSEFIGITCEGENDADIDNIGPLTFFPSTGFPYIFYPYKVQDNYRPPIVFVKFEMPKNKAIIQVWCKLWAKNIKHHKNDKAGSIHFELVVD